MRRTRFFNTTGPCNPENHYMLPPEERLRGAQLRRYIRDQLYWVLHAPRQTGKTTFLQNWMREINAASENNGAAACYVSVEDCQGLAERDEAMRTIYRDIRDFAQLFGFPVPEVAEKNPEGLLRTTLAAWASLLAPKALIVLFDEVDVLQGEVLISFLRQLRGGFAGRGVGKFPVSIALVGMRDLKDYIAAAKGGVPVNPGSPFNIKEDSATLSNFQKEDIARLFAQRTAETGQQITGEALDYVYEQSRGQPWIVNSLFMRATMRVLDEESAETVAVEHIREAREQMILARETHLDALAYRLEDPAIRSVMEALMTGEPDPRLAEGDAFRLCLDLGLVAIEGGTPVVANPLYRETLARQMTYSTQLAIPAPEWKWEKKDGTLDMEALLREFQAFWRTNSEAWEGMINYSEAFPHILLQAFLQRVTNGEGRIEREYAAGRGRMDLAVEYHGNWDILEIKLLRAGKNREALVEDGKKQTLRYRESFSPSPPGSAGGKPAACYLLIFDRRPERGSWEERLFWREEGDVTVVGC
jgi:hypothetical protein